MHNIKINTDTIKLDQFLKWANIAETGGQAKNMIQAGEIKVNDEIEYRRSHKLVPGDRVEIISNNEIYRVKAQ